MQVSAILLTSGQKSTAQALRSLREQSHPLTEILTIEGVRPFAAAFNAGVKRVSTPFFLQCDADMILHKTCLQQLLAKMQRRTALVTGMLDDPLQGQISGVKLFRTEVCRQFPLTPEPPCDVRQMQEWQAQGWELSIVRFVVGEHGGDLSDETYQFERFAFLGHKIRLRNQWSHLHQQLRRLGEQPGELAAMAVAATLWGVFSTSVPEPQSLDRPSAAYRSWQRGGNASPGMPEDLPADSRQCFDAGREAPREGCPWLEFIESALASSRRRDLVYLAGSCWAMLGGAAAPTVGVTEFCEWNSVD